MTQEFTTDEVADQLGKPIGTVKRWLTRVHVPSRLDGRGARRFGPEGVEALQRVKMLLDDGRSLESIRAILPGPESEPNVSDARAAACIAREPEHQQLAHDNTTASSPRANGESARELEHEQFASGSRDLSLAIADAVAAATADMEGRMLAVVREQTELAEKYARAAHMIGGLEAKLEAAEAEGRRLAESSTHLEMERERLASQLEDTRIELKDTAAVAARARELEHMLATAQAGSSLRRRAEEERDRIADELQRAAAERMRLEDELARATTELEQARLASGSRRPWWKVWG